MKRRLIILIAALAVTAAEARDTFVNTLSGYVVEAGILDAPDCTGPAFEIPSLETFEKGVCVFHTPARSAEVTARAIGLLDEAQIRGLPPVHQQFATLLTGLAHCDGATRHLETYRASAQQDLMARTLLCRDRRLAQAELNAIRWNHALFDYAEGMAPERSLDARLIEMSSCYAGVLSTDFDAECGLLTNPTDTEIDAFVDAATDEVITTYFSGVESPVTAMFARKLGRADGLLESAAANIANLAATAADVNAEYDALNSAYIAARDAKMAPIYDAYREAILRASAILDEFDRWKGGLFITVENINLLPKIGERRVELDEEMARVEALEFSAKAEALSAQVVAVIDGAEQQRRTVAMLCRVYFCELASRPSLADVIRTCRRPALTGNPLCIGQDGAMNSGLLTVNFGGQSTVTVDDLCRGAGVDPNFLSVGMSPGGKATCLEQMP